MRPRRILMRDDDLSHQIRLFFNGQDIAVSCTCLRGIDGTRMHHSPIEMRPRWEAEEALAVWQQHHHLQPCVHVAEGPGRGLMARIRELAS